MYGKLWAHRFCITSWYSANWNNDDDDYDDKDDDGDDDDEMKHLQHIYNNLAYPLLE
jgi:hypothetical protein